MATSISIPLSEDDRSKLTELAARVGRSPEDLLRAQIARWLEQPEDGFATAARYVLQKNAELYRRLA